MKNKKIPFLIASIVSLAALGAVSAHADSLSEKVNAIEQKQKVIERQWELQEEAQKDKATVSAGKEGFQIKSNDGKSWFKLRGLIQADGRFFIDLPQNLGNNTFVARRVRPIFEGQLLDRFGFRIVPDFGGGNVVLQDAYADVKILPEIRLRGGKFKEPVGLERLQSGNNLLFVERALPTSLAPNRDVGFQIFGDIAGGLVSYAVGAFNGVLDGGVNDVDNNDGKDIAGRIFVQPFLKTSIDALKGLGVGVAGTYGKQKGTAAAPNLPSYRTAGQSVFFRYLNDTTTPNVTVASGKLYRFSPQAYYSWGPFGFLGEYISSTQQVTNTSGTQSFTHRAWQTAASYVLTGEKASFKGVKPKNSFKPSEGKWGAVEVAARYNELRVDTDAFPLFASATQSARRARAFGGGVNWYLNDNVKAVVGYEHTLFAGGAAAGANRPSEKVVQTRLELAF